MWESEYVLSFVFDVLCNAIVNIFDDIYKLHSVSVSLFLSSKFTFLASYSKVKVTQLEIGTSNHTCV
jgi:hypothetical protein